MEKEMENKNLEVFSKAPVPQAVLKNVLPAMAACTSPPIKNSVASTGQLNRSFEYFMMYLQFLMTILLGSIYPKSAFLRNFRVLLK